MRLPPFRSVCLSDTARTIRVAFTTLLVAACTHSAATNAAVNQCVIEPVAVSPHEDRFSFRGLSHDGRLLAVGFSGDSGRPRGTYLLGLSSGQRRDISVLNNGGSYSPDGRFLVAAVYVSARNTEIIEYEIATGATNRIAPDSTPDFLPSYSPDGRSIVFNSYRTGASDLYRYDRATHSLERLTTFDGYDAHASYTPDGHKIVFHRAITRTNYDIVELDLRTRLERQLRSGPGEESYPAVSPDGRWLVYSADTPARPGVNDLWLLSLRDSTAVPLTTDAQNNGYAQWSRDSRTIYFTSRRSGRVGVYRLPVEACRRFAQR